MNREVGIVILVDKESRNSAFSGCLMYVTDVYDWGVEACMVLPNMGETYIRLKNEEFTIVGRL